MCTLKFLWRQTTNIVKLTRIELTFRRFLRFPERHRFGVWRLNFEFDARLLSWKRLDPKIRGVRRTRLTIRSIPSDRQNFFCFQAETMHRSFSIRLQAAVNGYKILNENERAADFSFSNSIIKFFGCIFLVERLKLTISLVVSNVSFLRGRAVFCLSRAISRREKRARRRDIFRRWS